MACEPLRQHTELVPVKVDRETLANAYARCTAITKEKSKTFYTASELLPDDKRQAMRALYAFCRITDDIVDRADGDPMADLEAWRERALGVRVAMEDPIVQAWIDTMAQYLFPLH